MYGPDISQNIPDINQRIYTAYSPTALPGVGPNHTDCIIMGIDPRNADWVAGPDGILFTRDDNHLGDTTVESPFELTLIADVPQSAVEANYETYLYLEIVPAP